MNPDRLTEAFARFDYNGDGFLTSDEIVEVLTRPGGGRPFTKEDAKAIVEKHDRRHEGPPHESRRGIVREKDGKLDYAEFSRALVVDMTLRADVDDAFVEGLL